MPAIYTYECPFCDRVFEDIVPISDFDLTGYLMCVCGCLAKRIITFNTGHRADPIWLDSACELLQPDAERPIESRSEFDKYLKKHDIVQRC